MDELYVHFLFLNQQSPDIKLWTVQADQDKSLCGCVLMFILTSEQ